MRFFAPWRLGVRLFIFSHLLPQGGEGVNSIYFAILALGSSAIYTPPTPSQQGICLQDASAPFDSKVGALGAESPGALAGFPHPHTLIFRLLAQK